MTEVTIANRSKYDVEEWVLEELQKKNFLLHTDGCEFSIKHRITGCLKTFCDLTTLENYANCLCFN